MKDPPKAAATGTSSAATTLFWLLGLALLAVCLSRLLPAVANQLVAPFDLVSESANLATIEALRAGKNIYSPGTYLQPPFTLTMYTPAYHHLVSRLPVAAGNPYLTGRLVAMCCMLTAAATLLFVERRKPGAQLGVVGISLFFLTWPVIINTAFLKNDSAALCLSALAVVTAAGGREATWRIVVSALLCTLALAAKQSFVAAMIACTLFYAVSDRRACRWFVACCALFLGALCLGGYWVWGPGFWFSTVEAVRQPMSLTHFVYVLASTCRQPLFVPVFGFGLAAAIRSAWRRTHFLTNPFGYYALVSWMVLLATLGKLGSSTNYFLEPCLATLMFTVSYGRSSTPPVVNRPAARWVCGALGAVVLFDVIVSQPGDYSLATSEAAFEHRLETRAVRNLALETIRPHPRILNLASATLTGELPGEVSVNDPYLYYLLWKNGQLPEATLVQALNARYFDALVVSHEFVASVPQERLQPGRWPRILNAIYHNYPLRREGPDVVFLIPNDTP